MIPLPIGLGIMTRKRSDIAANSCRRMPMNYMNASPLCSAGHNRWYWDTSICSKPIPACDQAMLTPPPKPLRSPIAIGGQPLPPPTGLSVGFVYVF